MRFEGCRELPTRRTAWWSAGFGRDAACCGAGRTHERHGIRVRRRISHAGDGAAAYDDADLNRAVQVYRLFFPTVSGLAIFKGNERFGLVRQQGVRHARHQAAARRIHPELRYAVRAAAARPERGPLVVELPPGPLIVRRHGREPALGADMGLPGPDAGKGGQAPAAAAGLRRRDRPMAITSGRRRRTASSSACARCRSAVTWRRRVERLQTIKVDRSIRRPDWTEPTWLNLTPRPQDTTPLGGRTTSSYWEALHEVIEAEPPVDELPRRTTASSRPSASRRASRSRPTPA